MPRHYLLWTGFYWYKWGTPKKTNSKDCWGLGRGRFQDTIDWVSTAMWRLNKIICLLKFSVPQKVRWENNYLAKVSTECQLSWSICTKITVTPHKKHIWEPNLSLQDPSYFVQNSSSLGLSEGIELERKKVESGHLDKWQVLKRKILA